MMSDTDTRERVQWTGKWGDVIRFIREGDYRKQRMWVKFGDAKGAGDRELKVYDACNNIYRVCKMGDYIVREDDGCLTVQERVKWPR